MVDASRWWDPELNGFEKDDGEVGEEDFGLALGQQVAVTVPCAALYEQAMDEAATFRYCTSSTVCTTVLVQLSK